MYKQHQPDCLTHYKLHSAQKSRAKQWNEDSDLTYNMDTAAWSLRGQGGHGSTMSKSKIQIKLPNMLQRYCQTISITWFEAVRDVMTKEKRERRKEKGEKRQEKGQKDGNQKTSHNLLPHQIRGEKYRLHSSCQLHVTVKWLKYSQNSSRFSSPWLMQKIH